MKEKKGGFQFKQLGWVTSKRRKKGGRVKDRKERPGGERERHNRKEDSEKEKGERRRRKRKAQ